MNLPLNNAFPVKNEHNSPVTKTTATKTIQKYCEVRSIAKNHKFAQEIHSHKNKDLHNYHKTELKTKT